MGGGGALPEASTKAVGDALPRARAAIIAAPLGERLYRDLYRLECTAVTVAIFGGTIVVCGGAWRGQIQ